MVALGVLTMFFFYYPAFRLHFFIIFVGKSLTYLNIAQQSPAFSIKLYIIMDQATFTDYIVCPSIRRNVCPLWHS